MSAGIGANFCCRSIVAIEAIPLCVTALTLPTLTPAIRTSALGTSRLVSVNLTVNRYPWAENGIEPPNSVHTKMISPMQESVNSNAAATAERFGAWVTI